MPKRAKTRKKQVVFCVIWKIKKGKVQLLAFRVREGNKAYLKFPSAEGVGQNYSTLLEQALGQAWLKIEYNPRVSGGIVDLGMTPEGRFYLIPFYATFSCEDCSLTQWPKGALGGPEWFCLNEIENQKHWTTHHRWLEVTAILRRFREESKRARMRRSEQGVSV